MFIKARIKILCITVLFCNLIFSQNNNLTISGIINDSESKTALEYTTISILDSKSKNLINGVVSDSNGFFNIDVSRGTYDIKVEYISFETKILENIRVEKSIDLGTVNLSINENIFYLAESPQRDLSIGVLFTRFYQIRLILDFLLWHGDEWVRDTLDMPKLPCLPWGDEIKWLHQSIPNLLMVKAFRVVSMYVVSFLDF